MFSPLDILYIVLAFCALWLTAGLFWLLWQIATIFRNVNDTLHEAREKMTKIEQALLGMHGRFEHATAALGLLVSGVAKVVEHVVEKKRNSTKKAKK